MLDGLRESLKKTLRGGPEGRSVARRIGWGVVFYSLLTVILAVNLGPQGVNVQVGQVALETITAPREVVNRLATERLQREAELSVQNIYVIEPAVEASAQREIDSTFERIRAVRAEAGLKEDEKLDRLRSQINSQMSLNLNDSVFRAILRSDDATLGLLEGNLRDLVRKALKESEIRDEAAVTQRRAAIDDEVKTIKLPRAELRTFLAEVAKPLIRPNAVVDEVATAKRRQEARAAVPPVKILKDQAIVRKNEQVTEEQLAVLRDLGMIRSQGNLRNTVGAILISGVLVILVVFYLYRYRRDILGNENRIVMLGLIASVTAASVQPLKSLLSGYVVPIPAATMLISTLIDPRLALLFGVVLSLFYGMSGVVELPYVLVSLVGGIAGVYSVSRVGQRSDLMRAGLVVGFISALSIFALSQVGGPLLRSATDTWSDPLWGLFNGVLSAILTIGSLPFLEAGFGIVTPVKLLELAHPNHPLLRKMLVEAPGTYHHSLMVANLAEAAAEAVGADPILARVGAYYHDIGKTKRPYFFIDNQFGGENPHDQISPHLSALIISSHVKDGVEMAKQHHLPSEIVDFIKEHHGTNLISYFYTRATENGKSERVLEEDFRYDGPKPQAKETAIVMLADASEAIVRSMQQSAQGPVPIETIETAIRKMIRDRLNDGQLDHSDLTFRDLDSIAKIFIKILSGAFHSRITYPDNELAALEKRGSKSGSPDRKPAREGTS